MMATVKDVNVPTETLPEDYTWAEDYTGGVVKPPTTTQPEYIFAGDRGEEEQPVQPAVGADYWYSSFGLPNLMMRNIETYDPRYWGSRFPAQHDISGINYQLAQQTIDRGDNGTVPGTVRPGQPTNPQTLMTGKEERGLGWNFDLESQPPQTYSGDLTFGGQGKGKGLTAGQQELPAELNRAQAANASALTGAALRFGGLNQSQQAYADALNAAYAKSIWWQGALQDRENLDRIRMAMANNKPNVRTYDPRTLGGHIVGDLVSKPGGYGGASKKYYYGGGGGGGRGYSSYSSPASWFNALLSWRI